MTTPLGGARGDVITEVRELAARLDDVIGQLMRRLDMELDAREEGDGGRPTDRGR